jgi:hypothetical protein
MLSKPNELRLRFTPDLNWLGYFSFIQVAVLLSADLRFLIEFDIKSSSSVVYDAISVEC